MLLDSTRRRKMKKTTVFVILCICLIGCSALNRSETSIESTLAGSPLLEEIKKVDSKSYEIIREEMRNAVRNGVSSDEAIYRVSPILLQFGMKYIPISSDDALIRCMEVLTRTMDELTRRDPRQTYKWLFPKQYGYVHAEKYVEKETATLMMNALADAVRTGASNPKTAIDAEEAEKNLEIVLSRLFIKYGMELEALSDVHAPQVDKKKACDLMIDFYNEILTLPRRESCTLFRYILTSEGQN
jgi:hypothetical protein